MVIWSPELFSVVTLSLQLISIFWGGSLRLCKYPFLQQTFKVFIYITVNSQCPILLRVNTIILMLKLSKICLVGAHPSWPLCPLDMAPSAFEHFLTFWHHQMFSAYLVVCLSPGSVVWRMVLWTKDQGAKCAHCGWGITNPRLSHWAELESTHTHIFYICIYFCVCLYMLQTLNLYPYFNSNTTSEFFLAFF